MRPLAAAASVVGAMALLGLSDNLVPAIRQPEVPKGIGLIIASGAELTRHIR